jgi:hypothetical protein
MLPDINLSLSHLPGASLVIRRISLFVIVCASLLMISGIASAAPKQVQAKDTDHIRQALTVKANLSYAVANAHMATVQTGEPMHSCRAVTHPSVWFKYKATRDITVTFDTNDTHLPYAAPNEDYVEDTVMSVYALTAGTPDKANFNKLAEVGCNDQAYDWLDYSRVTVEVSADQWYYIRVTPYLSGPMPTGSVVRLNVGATDLIVNGHFENGGTGWKLGGPGMSDDGLDCANLNDCSVYMEQSAFGNSKLTQTIDTLGGVKLNAGSTLFLAAHITNNGTLPDATLKLRVIYTDGTFAQTSEQVEWMGHDRSGTQWLTPSLELTKPAARVIVQFIVKNNLSDAWFQIDEVQLEVLPKGALIPPPVAPSDVLPVPQAPAGLRAAN